MSYVFMKVLESAPQRYERGMRLLTLGRLDCAKRDIASVVNSGERVLDIGCGTGTLALLLAERGAHVIGIDISVPMLQIALERTQGTSFQEQIQFRELGAVDLDTAFSDESFDLVVSTLTFSELSDDEVDFTLRQCLRLLKPNGKLILTDEILPNSWYGKLATFLFRLSFVILTYLLTQNTTSRLTNLDKRIQEAGFNIVETRRYLLGTLKTFVCEKRD